MSGRGVAIILASDARFARLAALRSPQFNEVQILSKVKLSKIS